ncbi:magnesium transporter [Wenzhouxiangella sp. AB-CW3]|uniref:magnesium transporter n=1 Tax=Wenzhouxiangella sp. AB-CW3 TaxID=2771012 RepID=UPI00168BDB88|nr:magnesium transporter [Wenzhouxiangella sp. AB-CW3]QOC23865.1 magnesium transporter [Wenzhouxiangella sp. AB-CW3]
MAEKGAIIELIALLRLDKQKEVAETLDGMPVQDIAEAMGQLDVDEQARLLRILPEERQTDTFSYLGKGQQRDLLEALSTGESRRILHELLPDDRTAFLESLSKEELENQLKLLAPEDLKQSLKLLGYPEESIGRLMTPRFVSIRPDWTVARSLDHIRHEADRGETVNFVFVTDERGHLVDAIRLKELILARQDAKVEKLMDGEFYSVQASADREEAVQVIQHYDINTLAVTDRNGVMLGIVTVDDIMDVAEAEITEDFHKIGGAGALNISLKDASPSLLYRKRVGWLLILVFMNLFGGEAIAHFEETIEAVIVLVFFLPLIVDSGGNAGSQSATLMVRALATGDVHLRDWFRLWAKEFGVAVALGVSMGLAVSLIGFYRGGYEIALVTSLAMVCVVTFGSMVGMLLPFLLTRFKLDPATASAPLITSIADIGGIIIYFSIATVVLSDVLAAAA